MALLLKLKRPRSRTRRARPASRLGHSSKATVVLDFLRAQHLLFKPTSRGDNALRLPHTTSTASTAGDVRARLFGLLVLSMKVDYTLWRDASPRKRLCPDGAALRPKP
jgi:hypothetical protein